MTPMLKQARGLGRHLPLVCARKSAPLVDLLTQFVDDRSRIVLLLLGRKAFAFVKNDLLLVGGASSLLWLRNRRNKFCAAPLVDGSLRWLPSIVQLPMLRRVFIRRIQDRVFEERVNHARVVYSRDHGGHLFSASSARETIAFIEIKTSIVLAFTFRNLAAAFSKAIRRRII